MKTSYLSVSVLLAAALLAGCNSGNADSGGLGLELPAENNITFSPDPARIALTESSATVVYTVADAYKSTQISITNSDPSCVANSPGTFKGDGSLTFNPKGKECNATLQFKESNGTTIATLPVQVFKPAPALTFDPAALILANTNKNGTLVKVTIKDENFTAPYHLYVRSSNATLIAVSPGYFDVNDSQPHDYNLTVNNITENGPTGEANVTFGTPDGAPPSTAFTLPTTYPVTVAQVTEVNRTIRLTNMCPYTVYPAISGGGFSPENGTCPTGSTMSDDNKSCFWNNPPLGSYALAPDGGTTTVTIPAGGYTADDHIWSGGIAARLKDVDGNWTIADCSGSADHNGNLQPCKEGVGFSSPSTIAEFTLLRSNNDTYDVTIITGITVPTSMQPLNHNAQASNPYFNGEAGRVSAFGGNPGATWTVDANETNVTVGSMAYFNLVDGNGSDSCDGFSCTKYSGTVCGYTKEAISAPNPTYTLSCGHRLAYLSADAVWKANPDAGNNTSPFHFSDTPDLTTQPYPNTNAYALWEFYECNTATGGPDTPYSNGVSDANACGCTDWDAIANPTESCSFFNAGWMNNVQPNITWAKKACPTCYTFPYDDKTSTFTAYNAVSTSNAANGTDYNITFCPGGKTVPDQPSYINPLNP